jgi:hypothetical protein
MKIRGPVYFCIIAGLLFIIAEFANAFPTQEIGIIGAILFTGGVIAHSITYIDI